MSADAIRLRIAPPTDLFPLGKGFYQLEEDALYVQFQPAEVHAQVFSYLESDNFRLDLDQAGRLLFIELTSPRHTWTIDTTLTLPSSLGFADIRCLEFRQRISAPRLSTDPSRSIVALSFSSAPIDRSFRIADSVILQTSPGDTLSRLIITDIVDDLAGRHIAAFRQSLRPQLERPFDHRSPGDL